jgi:excisionase family DNA binding protein
MLEFKGQNRALTIPEVAKRLRVHPETVRRWIEGHQLVATKLGRGGKLWITPADLQAFLKHRRTA